MVLLDKSANKDSVWHNKTVKIQEPIKIYDATDSLYSYLFKWSGPSVVLQRQQQIL